MSVRYSINSRQVVKHMYPTKFSLRLHGSKGYSSTREDYAQCIAQRYPVGSSVIVHYDPDKPRDGVLEVGGERRAILPLLVGLTALGLAFTVGGLLRVLGIL